jgi:hypothetical protein
MEFMLKGWRKMLDDLRQKLGRSIGGLLTNFRSSSCPPPFFYDFSRFKSESFNDLIQQFKALCISDVEDSAIVLDLDNVEPEQARRVALDFQNCYQGACPSNPGMTMGFFTDAVFCELRNYYYDRPDEDKKDEFRAFVGALLDRHSTFSAEQLNVFGQAPS